MSDTLTLEAGPVNVELDSPGRFEPHPATFRRTWTMDMARSALRHIHPDCDFPSDAFDRESLSAYELHRNISSALIGEFGKDNPETFQLVEDWSSGRLAGIKAALYNADSFRELFNKFDPSRASMGTVEHWAKKGLLMPGKWNPDGELLDRLRAMAAKSVTELTEQESLFRQVAESPLSTHVLELCFDELKRITGIGKTAIQKTIRENQRSARGPGDEKARVSAADILIKLGRELELWKSTDPIPEMFATVNRGENQEHLRIMGQKFKRELTHRFFEATNKAPSADAMNQAVGLLTSEAERGAAHETFLRIARLGDSLYLDLADEACNVVEITAEGWRLVKSPPVRLIRGAGKPLPVPQRGGNIKDLLKFINIDPRNEIDCMKIAAWLVAAFRPGFPFCILLVTGPAGSAKTTACNMLKSLVDPSAAQARGLPKTEDDLVITARSNHIIMADNLSGIPAEMADAICRLSTGGGISKRELYSDGDEYIIEAKRPIIINGINIPTNRQDLLDRSILVEIQPITDKTRKAEDRLLADFEAARPILLGVLLDGVVAGLRNVETLRAKVKALPRMADFALFAAAAMQAWGWSSETFLDRYAEMRSHLAADAGRSDAVSSAIADWIQGAPEQHFEGTSSDLLTILDAFRQNEINDHSWVREVSWPKVPNQLSRRIRTGASGLLAMGVGYEVTGNSKLRLIRLWWGKKPKVFDKRTTSPEFMKMLREDAEHRAPMKAEDAESRALLKARHSG